MSVSFNDLRYFRAVCENGSLASAGEAIGISQSALSKCLKRLEDEYGGSLVEWRDGRASATDIGQAVLRSSEDILYRLEDIHRQVQQVADGQVGEVRVGAGPYLAEIAVKPVMARLLREHPGVTGTFFIAPWNRLARMLYQKNLDFFVADIGDTLLNGGLDVSELAEREFFWYCRAGHPLADQKNISPERLTQYPFCGPDLPVRAFKWLMDIKRRGAGPKQVAPDRPLSFICDNWSMLRHFILNSNAVALVDPATIQRELDEGTLAILDVDHPPISAKFGAVRIANTPLTPLAQSLLDQIAENIRPH